MTKTMRIATLSYLHGLSGVGLFQRLELPYRFTPELIESGLHKHYFRVAMNALVLGGVVSLVCIGAIVFLVIHGEEKCVWLVVGFLALQHLASLFVRPERS